MPDDLIYPTLLKRYPAMDRTKARALGAVWSMIVDRIMRRMIEISQASSGVVLHHDHRADAIWETARFLAFANDFVLKDREAQKPLDQYDPADERARLGTPAEAARIEATAQMAAEHVWDPLMARWRRQRPLVSLPNVEAPSKLLKQIKPNAREHMHYVPQSTTRPWADPKSGKFKAYSIGLDGELVIIPSTAKLWGAEPYLYTQETEHHLGLIEGDAKRPFEKLVGVRTLSEADRRHWVAFLITQLMRTPRFLDGLRAGSKQWLSATGFPYPSNPASLGRAAETVFTNNDVFAHWYPLLAGRRWSVASAADGTRFLKGDNPVVISGRLSDGSWTVHYPLTPDRCFIAGPSKLGSHDPAIPEQRRLTVAETAALNRLTCRYADNSVIGVENPADASLDALIKRSLRLSRGRNVDRPFWGLNGSGSTLPPTKVKPRRR